MPAAVEAVNLVKKFGDFIAVDGISFQVPAGTVLGVLGPNGAGKTTTVRMMTTLSKPTSGSASVAGIDVVSDPARVRSSIGVTGQSSSIDDLLTGRQNLQLIGELCGIAPARMRERGDELLAQFSLSDAGDKVTKEYSGGMRRRLDLAMSLVTRPPVMFLDEPTTGLDPRSRNELWDVLRDLVNDGTTLVLTTQYLEEADLLAANILVIDHGKVIAEGSPLELKKRSGTASLVVTVSKGDRLDEAEATMRRFVDEVHLDRPARQLTSPTEGLGVVTRLTAAFEEIGMELDDIGLKRPSLDDVFLGLTGHKAEDAVVQLEESQ